MDNYGQPVPYQNHNQRQDTVYCNSLYQSEGGRQDLASTPYMGDPQIQNDDEVPERGGSNAAAKPQVDYGPSMKIYGGSSAFTIIESEINGFQIVCVEAALVKGNGTKQFDWENKVLFRFTRQEMYFFLAVLNKLLKSFDFNMHGANNTKSLHLEWQQDKLFMSVRDTNTKARAVAVSAPDAFLLTMFTTNCFLKNFPQISAEQLVNTLFNYVNS